MFGLIFWIVVWGQTVTAINNEGQSCYHITTKLSGTCIHLSKCMSVLEDIVNQKIQPQVCGLAETAPIVCCPETRPSGRVSGQQTEVGYKSRAKCLEYSKLQSGNCNIQYNRTRNVADAVGKEFPHMALLGYHEPGTSNKIYQCSGSLISERFVLTAGTCVCSCTYYGTLKYVLLGELDLSCCSDDAEPQELAVEKVFLHPGFNFSKLALNNIGLVKLERDVKFTPYVRPACLHVGRNFDVKDGLLIGGWTQYSSNLRQKMKRSLLRFVDVDVCEKKRGDKVYDEHQFCAEDRSCYCDWGGSLKIKRTDVECMYDLIGICNGFWKCPKQQSLKTSTFTRISYYIKWIEDIVWP